MHLSQPDEARDEKTGDGEEHRGRSDLDPHENAAGSQRRPTDRGAGGAKRVLEVTSQHVPRGENRQSDRRDPGEPEPETAKGEGAEIERDLVRS